jgi:hypothetical protein
MPQLNQYTWGTLPAIIVFFFAIIWIYFILYIRIQTKVTFLFFSNLQYKNNFYTNLLQNILLITIIDFCKYIQRQQEEYKIELIRFNELK